MFRIKLGYNTVCWSILRMTWSSVSPGWLVGWMGELFVVWGAGGSDCCLVVSRYWWLSSLIVLSLPKILGLQAGYLAATTLQLFSVCCVACSTITWASQSLLWRPSPLQQCCQWVLSYPDHRHLSKPLLWCPTPLQKSSQRSVMPASKRYTQTFNDILLPASCYWFLFHPLKKQNRDFVNLTLLCVCVPVWRWWWCRWVCGGWVEGKNQGNKSL